MLSFGRSIGATADPAPVALGMGPGVLAMRWGKVYALDVTEDSQAVATGLAKQAQAGIEEATAPKIES